MAFTETQLVSEKNKVEPWLNSQEGFTGSGIGIGRGGQICLKIFTNQMSIKTKQAIESRLQNLPHEFEETGQITAF